MRILEQPEATPRFAANTKFVADVAIPHGLIRGMSFDFSAVTTTDSAINDDAVWALVDTMKITIPLKRGDVVINSTGRDLKIASMYLTGRRRESLHAATAGTIFASFYLPFGPAGWGFHSEAMRPGAKIIVSGRYGAITAYGASVTVVATGILRPSLHVAPGVPAAVGRRALIMSTSTMAIDTTARKPKVDIIKPDMAEGLFRILFRQQDASVVAINRVDGLITRLILHHSTMGELFDAFWRELRGHGVEWSGIDRAEVVAALPNGLDGTAFYVASPNFNIFPGLTRAALSLTWDSQEATQAGATNVVNAAGDQLHYTVMASILPGA